jgi:hypothetical protein
VVEQMYDNRVILVLHMSCPVYCRFCFRKHKECREQPPPTLENVDAALDYLGRAERVRWYEHVVAAVVHVDETVSLARHREPAFDHRRKRGCSLETLPCFAAAASGRFGLLTASLLALGAFDRAKPEARHFADEVLIGKQEQLSHDFVLGGAWQLEAPAELADVHRAGRMRLEDFQDLVSIGRLLFHCT